MFIYVNNVNCMISRKLFEPYALHNNEFLPKVIDSGSLKAEFEIYKIFAFKERFNYELQQRETLDHKLRLKEKIEKALSSNNLSKSCLLYTSPSPRDRTRSRMPSSA